LNRHTATNSMAQGFLGHRQPPHAVACCGSKTTRNPHRMGIVAVWRFETGGTGLNPQGFPRRDRALVRALARAHAQEAIKELARLALKAMKISRDG
jgi:hypothetical protein